MTTNYSDEIIKEVLQLSKGNVAKARAHIMAMAQDDAQLLQELTKAHLAGIVSFHIERLQAGGAGKTDSSVQALKSATASASPAKSQTKQSSKKKKGETFGMELLKAVAQNEGPVFGFENNGPTDMTSPKGVKASQHHKETMETLLGKKFS